MIQVAAQTPGSLDAQSLETPAGDSCCLSLGPATITAMADNDAGGVATYSIAGATLGYPILFLLFIITLLLGITQEMGMRLTLVTRRGLADLIREKHGVAVSLLIFSGLLRREPRHHYNGVLGHSHREHDAAASRPSRS